MVNSLWVPLLGSFGLGVVIMLVPGLMIAVAVRQRGMNALGLAPALSIASIALSAMIFPRFGLGWALYQPFVFAAVVAVLGWVLCRVAARVGVLDALPPLGVAAGADSGQVVDRGGWFSRGALAGYAAVALGAVLIISNLTNTIIDPQWYSQLFDNNFHANAIRYISQTHNASSLSIAGMTSGDAPAAFYPAAWHDFVSLLFVSKGWLSVAAAANVATLVVAGVAWPASAVYMVRSIFRLGGVATVGVGALTAAYTAFPFLLLAWGVLYPNLLGIAILPAGVGLVAQLFRLVQVRRVELFPNLFLGVLVALGVAVAHPNAAMTLMVFTLPLLLMRMWGQLVAARSCAVPRASLVVQCVIFVLYLAFLAVAWLRLRPDLEATETWPPKSQNAGPVGEALLNGFIGREAQWTVSILALIGVWYLLRNRSVARWLVLNWAVAIFFYVLIRAATKEGGRYFWVGVWYSDSYRIAAVMPVFSLPLAALGLYAVVQYLRGFIPRVVQKLPALGRALANPLTGGVPVLALLIFLTQSSSSLATMFKDVNYEFYPTEQSVTLSPQEMDVLNQIPRIVPESDTIITRAIDGSSLAYAVTGYQVTSKHIFEDYTEDIRYINKHLNEASRNPKVCDIVRDKHLYYYLHFDGPQVNGNTSDYGFEGLRNLQEKGIAKLVYVNGGAKLYRVTACD